MYLHYMRAVEYLTYPTTHIANINILIVNNCIIFFSYFVKIEGLPILQLIGTNFEDARVCYQYSEWILDTGITYRYQICSDVLMYR